MWRRKCYYYLKRNLSAVNAPWRCDVRCNWSQKVQWLHMVGRMRGLQMNGKVPKVVASVLGFILSLLNLTGEILIENTIKYPKIEKKLMCPAFWNNQKVNMELHLPVGQI